MISLELQYRQAGGSFVNPMMKHLQHSMMQTAKEALPIPSTDQPEPIDLPPVEDFLHSLSRIHGCNECDITDVQEWIEMDSGDQGYELLNDEQIISVIQTSENDNNDETAYILASTFLPMVRLITC